jgi:HlyD family secretion protein
MSTDKPTLEGLRIDRTNPPRRTLAGPVATAILVVLALAGGAAWWLMRPKAFEVRTAVAREVSTGTGVERTVLNASGYVTARRDATVSSKITGKVTEVLIEEGTRVEAGQLLARLDASNTQANLQLIQAQLEAARTALAETNASLALAEIALRRQTELAAKNIISQSDLDRAEAEARGLRGRHERELAEIAVAERQVDVWKQQLDDTLIRAPFAGIVTSKNAQPGEMISPMSSGGFTRTGICTIVDMDSLEIEIDVNESYINRVTPGQPVDATLDAYADWKIPCKVIAIIPTADRQKSTVRVRVGFDRPDPRILPEMGVKVAFRDSGATATAAGTGRAVIIPRNAVRNQDGRDVVFVIQNHRAERRTVTSAGTQGGDVLLNAGVAAGEKIILDPPPGLEEGMLVEERNL